MYNLDPTGVVDYNKVKVPVILCHADSYKLGLGSNHGDVYHWFNKYGKTMDDVRKDVAKIMGKTTSSKIETEDVELYRVRKTWEDAKSQIGAYSDLAKAKEACNKVGKDYEVYNSKGTAIYPTPPAEPEEVENKKVESKYKIGQSIKLIQNAKYIDGSNIPAWVINTTTYVRAIKDNGDIVFSIKKTGAVTGVIKESQIYNPSSNKTIEVVVDNNFKAYVAKINTDVLNVRTGPGTNYKIVTQVKFPEVYTIVNEKNNWGQLKSGAGWICLDYVKKLVR